MSAVLIDYKNLLWRAADVGKAFGPRGGVAQFLKMTANIKRCFKNSEIVICFEGQGTNWRHEIFPAYKKNRDAIEMTDTERCVEGSDQILQEVLPLLGARCYDGVDCEGDDVIGTVAWQCNKDYVDAEIVSVDRDLWQLVDDRANYAIESGDDIDIYTQVICPIRHNVAAHVFAPRCAVGMLINESAVVEHMGIAASRIPIYKALAGDTGDGFGGVPGIGKITAKALAHAISPTPNPTSLLASLDDFVKRKVITKRIGKLLEEHRETLEACFKIATIKRDAKLIDRTAKRDDDAASLLLIKYGCTRAASTDIYDRAAEAFSWRSK